jgi:C1A family cysteine protease
MIYRLAGWLPDASMTNSVKAKIKPARSFTGVRHVFANSIKGKAADGTDYDIPNEPPCFDQGNYGSCVLNATVGAAGMVLCVEGQPFTMLSRFFLYALCNEAMGTPGQDGGTFPALAVDRIGNIGCCAESMWPYDDAHALQPPTQDCYPEASDNKATAWFSLDAQGSDRLAQLETTIRSNHPVIFGTPVDSTIQTYQAGQVLTIPDQNNLIGGHGIVFTGVRYINGQRCWRVRNSWGTSYGDNGHFLMDDTWASWVQLSDLWILTAMPAEMF